MKKDPDRIRNKKTSPVINKQNNKIKLMNRKFSLTIILLTSISYLFIQGTCSHPEEPEFTKLKDWKMTFPEKGIVEIEAVAVFYNPNNVGLHLREVNVDVFTDKEKLGSILQTEKFVKVAKNAAFDIPLVFQFNPNQSLQILKGNIFSILSSQKIVFTYKGYIKVQKFGVSFKVPLEGKEAYTLQDLRGG